MARLPRLCLAGIPQHIIQRGNNRQICFASEADFSAYSYWLNESAEKHDVSIHAWVFMTNHVHLLATPETNDGVSYMMQALGRQYVRYFNRAHKRTGTLWEGRFKSCIVDKESYLLICQRYIELNPVRAKMVKGPGDYKWSSYQANGLGKKVKLWTPHDVYLAIGRTSGEREINYRKLFHSHINKDELNAIRKASNQGMVLGSDRFKKMISDLTGRRVTVLKRGPSPSVL